MPQCDCRFARGSVSRRPTCHPRCAAQPTPQSMGVRAHVCCAVACAHVHARACVRACMWRSSVADTATPRPVAHTGAVALAALRQRVCDAAATRLRRCGNAFATLRQRVCDAAATRLRRHTIAAAAGRRARLPRHAGAAGRRGVSARNDHARLVPSAASRRIAAVDMPSRARRRRLLALRSHTCAYARRGGACHAMSCLLECEGRWDHRCAFVCALAPLGCGCRVTAARRWTR